MATPQYDPEQKRSATPFSTALMRDRARMQYPRRVVADHCGVAQVVIERWENGESIPSAQQFKRLMNLRGMYRLSKTPPVWGWLDCAVGDSVVSSVIEAVTERGGTEDDRPPAAQPFAAALQRVREDNSISQAELGELLGVTGQAVSAWETSIALPVLENLTRLFEVLPELAAGVETGSIEWPESRDINKPNGGEGTVRTMIEMALEQSDRERTQSRTTRPRWVDADMFNRGPEVGPEPDGHAADPIDPFASAYANARLSLACSKRTLARLEAELAWAQQNVEADKDRVEQTLAALDEYIEQATR